MSLPHLTYPGMNEAVRKMEEVQLLLRNIKCQSVSELSAFGHPNIVAGMLAQIGFSRTNVLKNFLLYANYRGGMVVSPNIENGKQVCHPVSGEESSLVKFELNADGQQLVMTLRNLLDPVFREVFGNGCRLDENADCVSLESIWLNVTDVNYPIVELSSIQDTALVQSYWLKNSSLAKQVSRNGGTNANNTQE